MNILTILKLIFHKRTWNIKVVSKLFVLEKILDWFGMIYFYGSSTIVGYLMPNPFLYI